MAQFHKKQPPLSAYMCSPSQECFLPVPGGTVPKNSLYVPQGSMCYVPGPGTLLANSGLFRKLGRCRHLRKFMARQLSLLSNKAPLYLHPLKWGSVTFTYKFVPSHISKLNSVKTKCLYSNSKSKDLWEWNVYILYLLKDTGCISSPPSWYLQVIFCTILAAMEN